MKYLLTLSIFLFLTIVKLHSQQDAQYTQYMFNTVAVNPAYTGSREVLSLTALHRSQWQGLDGAPTTQTFNLHSPVSERVGLGISIINDEIGNGTNQETYMDALFSYRIPFEGDKSLYFGLKAGGHFLNIDFTRLRNIDPTLAITDVSNIDNNFSPNFGFGFYFASPKYYIGLSIPNILRTQHFDNGAQNSDFIATERMNWYFISGYVFQLVHDLKFKPASLIKVVEGAPIQIDISANFLYQERLSFGVAYRWDAAFSGLIGYQLSERLNLGFAYDREITALGGTQFNSGTFELFLRYDFIPRGLGQIDPKFF